MCVCVCAYRHSLTYKIVMFQDIQHKSQLGIHMVNYKCLCKEAQLKSELQRGVRLLCLLYYSSATFTSLYFHYHIQKFSMYLLTYSMEQSPS